MAYLTCYPDVAAAGVAPLGHFIEYGAAELRAPHAFFDVQQVLRTAPPSLDGLHPLIKYVLDGDARLSPRGQGETMHVLLDTPRGVWRGENLGDVAMCAAAVLRLSALAPGCSIAVVIDEPRVLDFARLDFQPVPVSARAAWLLDPDSEAARSFQQAIRRAHVVAVTGHGAINDIVAEDTLTFLRVLYAAIRQGARTALLGHGVGPLSKADVLPAGRMVLPRLDCLCVREPHDAPAVLSRFGVQAGRIVVTGDDATRVCTPRPEEMRETAASSFLGFSLRDGYGMTREALDEIVGCVRQIAARERLEIIPLPVDRDDVQTLSQYGFPCQFLGDPMRFVEQARRCRAVVAGSYHAAVFSLAQGIPTVALSAGGFYRSKMNGLAGWFPSGCLVADFDTAGAAARLPEPIAWALARDAEARKQLVQAARNQSDLGDAAVKSCVSPSAIR
jgi:colanic acid/amylovoran biosynthesis protein